MTSCYDEKACKTRDTAIPGRKKLLVGHDQKEEGWIVANSRPGTHVDFVWDCTDPSFLSFLPDGSCSDIYACSVLQTMRRVDANRAMKEFYRVLADDGKLYLSVPDFCYLSHIVLNLDEDKDKDVLMHDALMQKLIFGNQTGPHDTNLIGFTYTNLAVMLAQAGFSYIKTVDSLGMFSDRSSARLNDRRISINAIVEKFEHRDVPTVEEQISAALKSKATLVEP